MYFRSTIVMFIRVTFLMVMSDYIVISVMKDNFKDACRFLKS